MEYHIGVAVSEQTLRSLREFDAAEKEFAALGKRVMEYTKNTRDELWNAIPKVALQVSSYPLNVIG